MIDSQPTAQPQQPRLLMLTHRFPFPPNRGDRIRAYHLLRLLSQDFSVTLASVANERVAEQDLQHVRSLCEHVVMERIKPMQQLSGAARSMLAGKSLTEGMLTSGALARRVIRLHQDAPFDHAFVFCSSMFPYVDRPAFHGVQMVVDLVDVDSRKWQQIGETSGTIKGGIYRRECRLVRRLEQRIVNRAAAVTLVSDEEARLCQTTVHVPPKTVVRGVSNGVDADYFCPTSQFERERVGDACTRESLSLVFTGVMNYHPNVAGVDWFCRCVMPKLRQRLNATFKIVGRFPNARVRALAQMDGVEVVGAVSDVRPYLAAADVVVAPLKLARGIQNKVLEGMAMQRPVVCTTPAAEGIDGAHGRHFLIADSVDQWCNTLLWLADDKESGERIALAAHQLVVEQYSWSARLRPMRNLMIGRPQEPAHAC